MKKYNTIIIQNYQKQLIDYLTLNDLGRINVFCGKNSSGKSTVLNPISELRKNGKALDKSDYYDNPNDDSILRIITTRKNIGYSSIEWDKIMEEEGIYDGYDYIYSGNDNFKREFIAEQFKIFTEQPSLKDKSYSSSEYYSLFRIYLESTGKYEGKPFPTNDEKGFDIEYEIPFRIITQIIEQLYPIRNSIRLIPPNRTLPSICKVEDYRSVQENGARLMNYLLFCKGQLEESNEFQNYKELKKKFNEISEGFDFDVIIKNGLNIELLFLNRKKQWLNADSSGLGLRDLLIMLSYFILLDCDLYLIEEPENHLHPTIQRRLLMYLYSQNKQFFIATHSNIFLDLDYVDSLFITENINGGIYATEALNKAKALSELGYSISDNLISDLIIFTEGPSDKSFLEPFLLELGLLNKYNIRFFFLGGDIMHEHDLSYLKDSYKVIALIDKDPGSMKVRNRFLRNCKALKIDCQQLERYSIENYVTLDALKEVFSTQIPTSLHEIDVNIKLEKQIGFDIKKCMRKLAKKMSLNDIKGTDLHNFLLKVETILKNKKTPTT